MAHFACSPHHGRHFAVFPPTTEGKDGVRRRFPRSVMAALAISLAAAWLVTDIVLIDAVPALADQVQAQEWWLSKLNVTQAWQGSRGSGVIVAVLSDGVVPAQSDLTGSVLTGPDYTHSGQLATGPYFGAQGTAIASLTAGHGHGAGGSAGVMGVAPAAKILSVRVTLSSGDPLLADPTITAGLPSAIAAGIRYAVRHGANVIDLPMDPGQAAVSAAPATTPAPTDGSAAEKAAVGYALSSGVVLVAPAGDNGAATDTVNYPAAYPGVIAVGAFDRNFIKAAFSSHQPYVVLTAPGAGVIAAAPPGGYAAMNSTAAASAIVSGVAALIRSQFPNLTPAQVTSALTTSTVFRPRDARLDGSGYGTVNAERALTRAAQMDAAVTRRAGAGALPRRNPSPPAVPTATASLAPRLLRYAVIAAGVLIVLLLAISAYWADKRRRMRRAVPAAALWQSPAADRFAGAQGGAGAAAAWGGHTDRMPDMFAANPGEPGRYGGSSVFAGSRVLPESGRYPGSGLANGNGYPDYGGRAGSAEPAGFGRGGSPAGRGDEVPAAGADSGVDADADAALAPFARTASRKPEVSGAPPWEPAPPPDSELSWAAAPPQHQATRHPAAAAPQPHASEPPWAAATAPASADDELTGDDGDYPADWDDHADSAESADDRDDGPMHSWNPGAATDTFPAVPDDRD